MPDGTILKLATAADYEICRYSNRRVTETQRRRKIRDCPLCGAPDVEWYSQVSPNLLYWRKHRVGEGPIPKLDIFTDANDDKAPF